MALKPRKPRKNVSKIVRQVPLGVLTDTAAMGVVVTLIVEEDDIQHRAKLGKPTKEKN